MKRYRLFKNIRRRIVAVLRLLLCFCGEPAATGAPAQVKDGKLAALHTTLFPNENKEAAAKDLPAAPRAPDWTSEHMIAFKTFLCTTAGVAFMERWRSISSITALKACEDSISPGHSAGKAAGFEAARLWAQSLSRVSCDMDTEPEANGEKDEAKHRDSRGEAELLEQYSP